VLVLTGPPAAGKTTIGRILASSRPGGVLVEADDVRHMLLGSHPSPGDQERPRDRFGVIGACCLARTYAEHGYSVIVADRLTDDSAAVYRALLGDPLIVRLVVSYPEALRRFRARTAHQPLDQLRRLQAQEADLTGADSTIPTDELSPHGAADRIATLWRLQRQP
jgi:predicted kinase